MRLLPAAVVLLIIALPGSALSQVSRDFIENAVPKKYPQLVAFLKTKGSQEIKWVTQSKEQQAVQFYLASDGSVTIEAAMPMGSASTASSTKQLTKITLIDKDRNGTLDRLEATPPGEKKRVFDSPRDEGSMFLWYSTLAIIFSRSSCCPG